MISLPSGTVTFLFTDFEGSTKLAREHAETWEESRARHHQISREAIEANNGYVFQVIGDAFCAVFNKAGGALKAAGQAQRALQVEDWKECVIRVQMGIHTGDAEVRSNAYEGYLTLSLIQRLMSAGHGGQIWISNATGNLLRGRLPRGISLRDMGQHKFKDVPSPVRVFQVAQTDLQQEFPALRVLDASPNNLPTQLTSFVGREKEVADVKRLLANTHLPQDLRRDMRQKVSHFLFSQVTLSASAILQLMWRLVAPGTPTFVRQFYSPFMSVEEMVPHPYSSGLRLRSPGSPAIDRILRRFSPGRIRYARQGSNRS